jgi:hypothetical protein
MTKALFLDAGRGEYYNRFHGVEILTSIPSLEYICHSEEEIEQICVDIAQRSLDSGEATVIRHSPSEAPF